MNEKKRSRRDFIQNITIAVLTVSAVLLFVQSQFYNLGSSSKFSQIFVGPTAQTGTVITSPAEDVSLCLPLHIAVTSTYGRYGDVTMTTADGDFLSLRQLLAQALDSSQALTISSSHAFMSALNETSVFYDFLSPLPLSVLTELASGSSREDHISARYLVIAVENGTVMLHIWDGGLHYYRGNTALSPEDLDQIVSLYEFGNAFFAFESTDAHAQSAAPCSLFLEETPVLPQLSSSSPLSDTTVLLASLHFNPNTQNRYMDSDGTEVISESNNRTLQIHSDGTVQYQSENNPTLSIEAESDHPSLAEAATEVNKLLSSLLSSSGDARIYLEQIEQDGDLINLWFGYQIGGIPVLFADGQPAAFVTLSGTSVSSMTLRFRQYSITENNALLLPIRQALAIAADTSGNTLSIGYVDAGDTTTTATWLAD